jgi:hypothetical protein
VLISSHRKLLLSKAMVLNVAEKSERDFGRCALGLQIPDKLLALGADGAGHCKRNAFR